MSRLAAERAVERVFARSHAIDEAMPRVLEVIGTTLRWTFGAFWKSDGGLLRSAASWHARGARIGPFANATREMRLTPGVGLPGRVWASGEQEWIVDLSQDHSLARAEAMARGGLRTTLAFPIRVDDEIFGVMEFFSRRIRRPEHQLDLLMANLAMQVGRFVERVRAQDSLRASETRKQAMLDASLDGIVSIDHEGRILEYNRAAEAIFGYRREDVLGAPLVERLIPPALREAHLAGFGRYLATGADRIIGQRVEMPALRADGSEIPVELAIVRLETPGPPMFTGFIRDLSERKRAEREHARLAAIVESAEDAIFAKTLDGIITAWNPAAERLYGYAPEDAIGHHVAMLIPPDRVAELDWIMERLRHGERITQHETVRLRRDGARLDVALTISPIVDASGRVIAASTIARDIREQKHAASALRESEERLRLATEAAGIGLWFWDMTANRIEWTPACWEIFGVVPGRELTYGTFLEWVHPDDRERVGAAIARARDGGDEYAIELRVVRPTGEVRWVAARGRVFRDESGQPVRMLGVAIDVTDAKRIEQQREALLEDERAARSALERHLRQQDEFLATVSHELRTPLTAILGWAHVLLGRAEAAPLAAPLAAIERNAKLQTQIVTDLLDMSRIVSGKLRIEARSVAVARVVGAAVETMQPAAQAKGIVLAWDPRDEQAALMRGDADRLQQVFWNLLSNAVKFTPRGGRIEVSMGRAGTNVEVRVADTGQGIAPDFLPHLFERFRQADASRKRKHGGLGLGLAIVKELVELHGGTVQAESAGPGKGATFLVALPIAALRDEPVPARRDERRAPAAEPVAAVPASLRGVKVLVVDDQEDARELLGRLLQQRDAEVVTAASALEALDALGRERPDVLVSDIGMPEVDGYELIRRVRALAPESGGLVPAVALTAFVRPEDQERALAEGYHAHLPKPIEPARLLNTVAALASGSAMIRPEEGSSRA